MLSRGEYAPGRPPRSGRIVAGALLAVVAALPGTAHAAPPTGWGIAQLMQSLAQRGAEHALFVEKKYLAILDRPLESSGELRYAPPDRLEKRTLKPRPESVVLEGDTLRIERGNQIRLVRIGDYPEIAAVIESIRGTLAGDRAALERVYRLELHGTPERWTLVMLPSDTRLAAAVLRIDVTGTGDRVRTIEIRQADGDRSVLSVERVAGDASSAPPPPAPR